MRKFHLDYEDIILWPCLGFVIGGGLFAIVFFLFQSDFFESVPFVCSGVGFGAALGGVISLRRTLSNVGDQNERKKLEHTYTRWSGIGLILGIIVGLSVPNHLIGTEIVIPIFIGTGASIGAILSKKMLRSV